MKTVTLCVVLLYDVFVVSTNADLGMHTHQRVRNKTFQQYGPRIYHGQLAADNQFPFMVLLLRVVGDRLSLCSANYIKPKWVLTAAHCISDSSEVHPRSVYAWSGRANMEGYQNYRHPKYAQMRRAKSLHVHPKYKNANYPNHDIGLIQLDRGFDAPVSFGTLAKERANILHNCTIVGWGRTEEGKADGKLRYATGLTFYIPEEGCTIPNPDLTAMCFDMDDTGALPGDSGGPAICNGLIHGVASFGNGGTDDKFVQVYYTNVAKFNNWISSTIEGLSMMMKPNAWLVFLLVLTTKLTVQ